MEVLVRGIVPAEKTYTISCYSCGSIIKFKRSEACITYDQRDGTFVHIICPVCDKMIGTTE